MEETNIHGFNINGGDHHGALKYMGSHMSKEQVEDMVRTAERGHSAHFMVNHEGQHLNYKLEHLDGKLTIHEAHNK